MSATNDNINVSTKDANDAKTIMGFSSRTANTTWRTMSKTADTLTNPNAVSAII
jgi:hypothetical protein